MIGMGTWQTFNVGGDPELRQQRTELLQAFFDLGGGMVDCSPMYGSSADVLGVALNRLGVPDTLFSAEKVWTRDGQATREQIQEQAQRWNLKRFDLMQIHNLLSWEAHLENLRELKRTGEIRYIGITTSHGRRHREVEQVMEEDDIDFVQLTYNLTHREVENRLLPAARERGLAVIANRPYDGGHLIRRLQRQHEIPAWTRQELRCATWADVLLKFIVSHPAITCAIPATTRLEHLRENMQAGQGLLPDPDQRNRMIRELTSL
jgi:diketogulonate reductase-like aldo/keto reductase